MNDTFSVTVGEPLPEWVTPAKRKDLIPLIEEVQDPELFMNIVDLGLIYAIDIDEKGNVDISMTVTAPGCPIADELPKMVADAVLKADGVGIVTVKIVWDPPWELQMLSDKAKMDFDLF